MTDEARDNHAQQIERAEIANLVRSRMESLNLPTIDYDDVSEKRNSLSYVIINPSCDLKLEEGDVMYDTTLLGTKYERKLPVFCIIYVQLSSSTVSVLSPENVRAPQLASQVQHLILFEPEYGSRSCSGGGRWFPPWIWIQSEPGRRRWWWRVRVWMWRRHRTAGWWRPRTAVSHD